MESTLALEKHLYIRFLLHILGDIHQPLHAIETFSTQFVNGDVGGNSVGGDI